ncbi:MAG: amidohydrolase [Alphaproteobacteria bacterium]|nr:amidohydrolase [Alphaproteobacteria bacterium]
MSLLLKNVTHQGEITDILIENGHFAHIAPNQNTFSAQVLDCHNKAILPAFYNLHSHAGMSIFRGLSDDKELFSWLNQDIWPREAKLTPDMIYLASKFSILEMIKTGTVFFLDMYFEQQEILKAATEMGVRTISALTGLDLFDAAKTKVEKEKIEKYITCPYDNKELCRKGLMIHAVYSVSEDLIRYIVKRAKGENFYLTLHASETAKEVEDCLQTHGCTPIEYLNKLGALDSQTIVAHAVHLTDNDIALLARKKVPLCTNPISNYKLASGLFMLQKLQKAGCVLTLGTDSMASNNNLSMLDEMKTCALSAKIQSGDATAGCAEDIFAMATVNGAKAVGLDAGVIEEGKLADCILVDLNNHFLVPNYNLISNMVYSADSSCIDTVICNGNILMQNHVVPGEKELITEIKKLSNFFRN